MAAARYTFVRLMSPWSRAWVHYTLRSPKVVVIETFQAKAGGGWRRTGRRVTSRERAVEHMATMRHQHRYRVSLRNPPDVFFDALQKKTPTAAAHAMIVKFGMQAAGWAKTLLSSCRTKTAKEFWTGVNTEAERLLYHRNPSPHTPVMSYAAAHSWESLAKARGVSAVARSGRGFMRAYEKAGTWAKLDPWWKDRRDAFVARHMAQVRLNREKLWKTDRAGKLRPSRRCLALIMWAHLPPR